MTNIVTGLEAWLNIRKKLTGKKIGFVPTMGHLHEGHLSLCARARRENEVSVVSIYVNPAQFNQQDDFAKYPRTLAADREKLAKAQVDYLLVFNDEEMYPDNYEVRVTESVLGADMEGEFRPGHFDGVLTVVLKLLNLVQPARAYFGEKDYQQLIMIKKMVKALFVPVEIAGCATVRADDGLALSSRNSRLTSAQRAVAAHLPRTLQCELSLEEMKQRLTTLGFKVDYIAEKWQRRLAAVWLGDVRLIDNIPT